MVHWNLHFSVSNNKKYILKKMELTSTQTKEIDEILSLVEDELSFEEKHEEVMDICLDNGVFNLQDDEDGDLYEEYSNLVWDYLEDKEK